MSNSDLKDLSPFAERIKAGWPVRADFSGSDGLIVNDCPLETPPLEIVKQGPEAVRNYFIERDRQSTVRLYEAKVLIVGEGGAGKTTLLRRLYQPDLKMPQEDETTHGIEIHRQDFAGQHGGEFRLNLWDFGGQQIYHATHQFFLTKRSLYVLVDDTRKDDKSIHDESFRFWLNVVETLSEKSPLLIFQNEKCGRSKALDQPGIRGRFENVKEFFAGDLEHSDAADKLRQAIQHQVQQLPHVGSEVPAKWLAIRDAVEELGKSKPFISQDEYFAIYGEHLEADRMKTLFLSRYLHDLGVFLHFQDDLTLKKTVILQNRWATDAVFRVLDDEETKGKLGHFTLADCSRLWHEDKYADMHAELIGLMRKFELCYQLPDQQPEQWLAPQLLPVSKPALFDGWAKPSDLVVRFKYQFLPRRLVSRLMVRQHRFVKQWDWSWRHGAFFEHEGTQVLVEETKCDNRSEIEFRARGPERKELLSVLAGDLEALNNSFKGLKDRVDKLVPCICNVCSQTIEPEMYRQKELIERRAKGKRTIECRREPYDDVEVLKLLEGIEPGPLSKEMLPTQKRFRVALSFAGENRDFVKVVAEQLSEEVGQQRVLYDQYYEAEFSRLNLDTYLPRLYREEAELVVVFLCPDYRSKRWCQLEWRHIKNLITTVDEGRIMLTSFDDPGDLSDMGILSGDGYAKIGTRSAEEISNLILQRLQSLT